jgi:hypothetical protein
MTNSSVASEELLEELVDDGPTGLPSTTARPIISLRAAILVTHPRKVLSLGIAFTHSVLTVGGVDVTSWQVLNSIFAQHVDKPWVLGLEQKGICATRTESFSMI